MHRTTVLTALAMTGLFLAGVVAAQQKEMYRWTDEHGVVHFSDTAPAGRDVQPEQVPPGDAPAAAGKAYEAAAEAPASSAAEQRREEIAQRSKASRAEQAEKASQCASWRDEVARLEPNRRVYFTNEQGETERMDDVVRTNRVAELKGLIAENCD